MRSSIETDIPMAMQLEFANYVRDASLREVRQLVLDSRYGEETYAENGAWILLPDRSAGAQRAAPSSLRRRRTAIAWPDSRARTGCASRC